MCLALRFQYDTIDKVTRGVRGVSASMAIRVARLADVQIEDVLDGTFPGRDACPHCGHPRDEEEGSARGGFDLADHAEKC